MPSPRSARLNARRLALLAVAAPMVFATSATAVLEVLAEDGFGVPVHVESPENDGCPAAHNHAFCQVARSLADSAAPPCNEAQATPAPARLVFLPSAPEPGPSRLAFLTDCVVPRGPPLV